MKSLRKSWAIIRYTFRESLAKKTFVTFFALSTLVHLFFIFALNVDVINGAMSMVKIMGQNVNQPNLQKILVTIQSVIATTVFTGGIFLSIFTTAGLIPSMLEKGYIELLISKPLSRTQIFLSRYIGALSIMAFNVVYLILGSWLILSIKTGIWYTPYLYSIPMIMVAFAIIYAVMALVGVASRSAGVTIMVAFAVFFLGQFLIQKDAIYAVLSSKVYYYLLEGLYHSLPKTFEISKMNLDLVLGKPVEGWSALWTSCLSGTAMLSAATIIFNKKNF